MKIDRAAIRLADGRVFSVPKPGRHHHVIAKIIEECDLERITHEHTQGFVTDTGEFVDRKRAAEIAKAADQLIEPCNCRLFSEMVW